MGKQSTFNILQLSDIHGADFLIREISRDLKKADMVVLVGDITHFGHCDAAENILEQIRMHNRKILAVSGNCDYKDVDDYLNDQGIGMHARICEKAGWQWFGISGSLPCPGKTPNEFTEQEVQEWLDAMSSKMTAPLDFLVSHQPPVNTLNDKLPDDLHVGSHEIRQFIERTMPLVCMTAHIHEGIGIDYVGPTAIVNPGPFRTGKYALISVSGKKSVNIELKQITA